MCCCCWPWPNSECFLIVSCCYSTLNASYTSCNTTIFHKVKFCVWFFQALLSCPTSSIHTEKPPKDILQVQNMFPLPIDDKLLPVCILSESPFPYGLSQSVYMYSCGWNLVLFLSIYIYVLHKNLRCSYSSANIYEIFSLVYYAITSPTCNVQGVYLCGYNSEDSYGATSYLVIHPQGNILIDRYYMGLQPLARNPNQIVSQCKVDAPCSSVKVFS